MKEYYFAYGSNMDLTRMVERKIKMYSIQKARLDGYDLKFNKFSKKQGACANLVVDDSKFVEGILYEIENIKKLDKFEGYPNHYERKLIHILGVDAWVYFAKENHIKEGMIPSQAYMNRLLAGKYLLSEDYYKHLLSFDTQK